MKMCALKVRRKNKFNLPLFCLMILLVFIGCVFVYSASCYSAGLTYGDEFFFLKKQVFGIVVGLVGFFIFSFIDYKKLEKLKWLLLVCSIVLLGLVLQFIAVLVLHIFDRDEYHYLPFPFVSKNITKFF